MWRKKSLCILGVYVDDWIGKKEIVIDKKEILEVPSGEVDLKILGLPVYIFGTELDKNRNKIQCLTPLYCAKMSEKHAKGATVNKSSPTLLLEVGKMMGKKKQRF
jgi:hypothetical protein